VNASNSAAQVSTVLNTGRIPRAWRWARTCASVGGQQPGDLGVGEPVALGGAQHLVGQRGEVLVAAQLAAALDELQQLVDEPRVVPGELADPLDRPAAGQRLVDGVEPLGGRPGQSFSSSSSSTSIGGPARSRSCRPRGAQRLVERLLEGAAHRHHLAHRLHPGGQRVVGAGNFSNAKRGILVTT
jgi:hypothetical protein